MATPKGDNTKPTAGDNTRAENAESKAALSPGSVYQGEITARAKNGTYEVRVSSPRVDITGAYLAGPVIGGLLGFMVRTKLLPGTKVFVVHGDPSFIVAVSDPGTPAWEFSGCRSMVGGKVINTEEKDMVQEIAEDSVEGEFEISNLFGVALRMGQNFAQLAGGDRAKVEAWLLNDMVRIVSRQYRHFSGMGDETIFDHGRCSGEKLWSSYRHELMNKMAENEPFFELKGDEIADDDLDAKHLEDIGRHRLVEYTGFIGDFIHAIVCDPPPQPVKLHEGESHKQSGKSFIHRNNDGSIVIQSAADIIIEHVTRIPTAARIKSVDLEANRQTYENLNKDYLKLIAEYKDRKNAWFLGHKLRKYSRWLTRLHSFQRLRQMQDKGEFKVFEEEDVPAPDWKCKEKDKEEVNPDIEYFDTYSCVSIFRNGDIVVQDGSGSSVTLSGGNIHMSAVNNLRLEAGGDMSIIAGGSLFLKARRHVEIVAAVGGVIISGFSWMKMVAEKGVMWFRSQGKDLTTDGEPEQREEGPMSEVQSHAMIFETPDGSILHRADKQILIKTDLAKEAEEEDTGEAEFGVQVDSKAYIRLLSDAVTTIDAQDGLAINSQKGVSITSPLLYTAILDMDFGGFARLRSGNLTCNSFTTNFATINKNIRSPWAGPMPPPPEIGFSLFPVGLHGNHVHYLPEEVEILTRESDDGNKLLEIARQLPQLKLLPGSPDALLAYPPPSEYTHKYAEQPETLAQEFLQHNKELALEPEYPGADWATWDWGKDFKWEGKRLGTHKIGYGNTCMVKIIPNPGKTLHEPSNDMDKPVGFASVPVRFKRLKIFDA